MRFRRDLKFYFNGTTREIRIFKTLDELNYEEYLEVKRTNMQSQQYLQQRTKINLIYQTEKYFNCTPKEAMNISTKIFG